MPKVSPGALVVGLIGLLVPQALAVTIPMALLLALLVAFGRLSADREFVAMQACGISLRRLLWPVALISISAWAATSYVLIALVPGSNQKFLDTVFNVASQRAEGEVKARTFFTDFPNFVLYVRELQAGRQRVERRLPGRPSRRSRRGGLSGPERPCGHRPPAPTDRPGADRRHQSQHRQRGQIQRQRFRERRLRGGSGGDVLESRRRRTPGRCRSPSSATQIAKTAHADRPRLEWALFHP